MEVLVFKTNVADKSKVSLLHPLLGNHPQIIQWNVDLHDDDKVLRVEANGIAGEQVEKIITAAGFECTEFN
jgi:hypothetical protein